MLFRNNLLRFNRFMGGGGSRSQSRNQQHGSSYPPAEQDPPVAEAGDNQTVSVGATVSFDGSGSTGSNLSYSWDFGADATPATGSGDMPSCTYSTPGTKIVTLTVTDTVTKLNHSDIVTITVHSVPVARAGSDQIVAVDEAVSFDGSGSTGNNLSYSWDFGADATPATGSGVTASCTYSTTGAKTVTLTVSNTATGLTDSDTVTINVHNPPVAEAGDNQTVSVGATVSFDGSGSTGNNLSYSWDFGADATPVTGSGDMPSCTYSASGDKVATLTVTDTATRLTASDTVTIYVYSRTATLAAEAGSDQTVAVGATVSFDGSGSTGNNLVYSWDFGTDAMPTTSREITPSCTYSTPGAKTVTLTVTDVTTSARPTASDTVTINVHNPPVADAGDNQTVSVGATVSFDGSDSTGNNLSYSWDFGADATPATGTGSMPSCTYSTSGTKIVTLTVTDTVTRTHITVTSLP